MKSIQKSVRLSPEVYEFICEFEGKNFNDKLENSVKFIKEHNVGLRKQKIRLEMEICDLTDKVNEYRRVLDQLENIANFISFACDHYGDYKGK